MSGPPVPPQGILASLEQTGKTYEVPWSLATSYGPADRAQRSATPLKVAPPAEQPGQEASGIDFGSMFGGFWEVLGRSWENFDSILESSGKVLQGL